MNKSRVLRWLSAGIFLFSTAQIQASLVSVGSDVFIGSYTGASDVLIALDTNVVTGEYVVCYAVEDAAITCSRRDSNDNGLSNVFISTGTSGVSVDFNNLDVALNDNGDVYVLWTGTSVSSTDTVAFVQAFDSSGQDLFLQQETTLTDLDRVSLALSPSSYWVIGSSRETVFDSGTGTFDATVTISAEYFDTGGNSQGTISLFSNTYETLLFDLNECNNVGIASNRSGDLVLTWVEPSDNVILLGACTGSVYAQTYRESGTAISDATQVSDTDSDDDGNDVSAYFDPVATAYENGEYVIAWTDDEDTYVANLALDGDVATSQETLLSGSNPKIGGSSASEDYVVITELTAGLDCSINARLAFDADTDPEATFSPADCNFDSDINFSEDGNMILARTTTETGSGNIVVNRIGLPAEIEVSNVSVQEGDDGTSGVAAVEISLNRAHPADEDIQVSYFTRDDTALLGIDYEFTQGSVTFTGGSGVLSQIVLVPLIGDSDFEDDEIFDFILENAVNAVLKNDGDEATITIQDDDSTPDITANCTDGNANNCQEIQEPLPGESTDTTVILTLAEAVDSDITVSFSTEDGTATAGEDYVATSGTLQLQAGSTEVAFVLTVLGDDVSEDTETFIVNLSGSDSVSIPDTELTFSILNDTVCFVEIDPNAVVATSDGGSESFEVTTLDDCMWDVSTNVSWVTITSATSNTGSGTVTFDVDPFDPPAGTFTRSGTVTVTLDDPDVTGSADFIIDQDGDCSFTIDSDSMSFDVSGGTGSFNITPNDESCDWDATSSVDWVTITSPTEPVMGSGSVSYQVSENTGDANEENSARSITLTSEEFDYTINQDGCTYDLDATTATVVSDGDSGLTVGVLAPTSASGPCPWTAVSNATWILIADGASGTGGGTVTLDVLENASIESRTGTVSIGGNTFTVEQDGQACVYELDPTSFDVCPDGQSFDITVTATDGCSWSLTPQQSWLEVINNASGIGSETASGVVDANLSEDDRTGSVDLTVTRFGASVAQTDFSQSGYLLYEDFSAGLPADWFFDPVDDWSVQGNGLVGELLTIGGIGKAIDQTTACKDCKIETTMSVMTVSSGSRNSATLIAWFEDDDNHVGLAMDEFSNRWILFQRVNGVVSENTAAVDEIVPNVSYELAIRYDGDTFYGDIDGVNLLQLPKQLNTDPIGFAGFEINNNNARFSDLRVTGDASNFEVLFDGGFEQLEPVVTNACTF